MRSYCIDMEISANVLTEHIHLLMWSLNFE